MRNLCLVRVHAFVRREVLVAKPKSITSVLDAEACGRALRISTSTSIDCTDDVDVAELCKQCCWTDTH